MSLSNYFLGSFKDGQFRDIEGMREKSDSRKLIFVREDTTTRVYDDVNYVDIPFLYAQACRNEGMYVMRETGGEHENDRYYEVESSDSGLNETEVVCAYDEDNDSIYAVSYLDCDENDIFMTSETIGRQNALDILHEEIKGDTEVVRVDKIKGDTEVVRVDKIF